MKKSLKTYIFYEIGDSCRAEFLMKDGNFSPTEDAVVIGISDGCNPKEAFRNLKLSEPWIKNYKTEKIVAREVGKAFYF